MTTKPLKSFAAGGVRAAIWENEIRANGSSKKVLKASAERRRYKDKDGSWKSSQSFSRNELPLAVVCLSRAFETIVAEEKDEGNGGNGALEEAVE